MRALRGERAAPGTVDRQFELGAQAARGVVDGLEQRADRDALAAAQVGAQLADQAFEFGEHDGDGDAVGRFGDARGDIGAGGLDAEPDQLPRRRQPAHHDQQRRQESFAVEGDGRLDQHLGLVEMAVGEVVDVQRQMRGEGCQRVARFERAQQDERHRPRRAACRPAPAGGGGFFRRHWRRQRPLRSRRRRGPEKRARVARLSARCRSSARR